MVELKKWGDDMKVTPMFIDMEIEQRLRILLEHVNDDDRIRSRISEYGQMRDYLRASRPTVDQFLDRCKEFGGEWGKLGEYLERSRDLYG